MVITGISASPGVAIGKAFVYGNHKEVVIEKTKIDSVEKEIKKLEDAISKSREELSALREDTLKNLGEEKAQIFDAHLLLLDDPEIKKQVCSMITNDMVNSAYALDTVTKTFVSIFEAMDDAYMKERVADIKDVYSRVTRHILGIESVDLSRVDNGAIIVAHDLTPSETATLNKDAVLGFITNIGGKTSHSAIMARTMEVPAIVGLGNITEVVKNDDLLVFDGEQGQVYINPDQSILDEFQKIKTEQENRKQELSKFKGVESVTLDNHSVKLGGNIGHLKDMDSFEANDAEAVGLYRTEFLFMDKSQMPSEQEQYEIYSSIVKRLDNKECIFRTLDIGGDKNLDYLDIGHEENPFLGYRAIRICLDDKELFKAQLRAMLRTSTQGNIGIMFPMISSVNELLEAKSILEQAKQELIAQGISVGTYKVGMMIEIPSAAIMSDILANHVDFFSIGTNDLTQYTCAVDRMNEKVAHLYDPFNPGLLRLINMVAKNGLAKGVEVAMCGSMAHDPLLVPLFVGMGLTELSMSPMHVLTTRKLVRGLNFNECKKHVEKVLELGTSEQVKEYLKTV
ncbi:MAG: phosphoenolpyruvate--protein phosphotransferase [Bacteriovoracaceae bacterium]|nr:phosphoenolpyruvate--protein phosphotransferase [Bacteriovoracaceae bacterium]